MSNQNHLRRIVPAQATRKRVLSASRERAAQQRSIDASPSGSTAVRGPCERDIPGGLARQRPRTARASASPQARRARPHRNRSSAGIRRCSVAVKSVAERKLRQQPLLACRRQHPFDQLRRVVAACRRQLEPALDLAGLLGAAQQLVLEIGNLPPRASLRSRRGRSCRAGRQRRTRSRRCRADGAEWWCGHSSNGCSRWCAGSASRVARSMMMERASSSAKALRNEIVLAADAAHHLAVLQPVRHHGAEQGRHHGVVDEARLDSRPPLGGPRRRKAR